MAAVGDTATLLVLTRDRTHMTAIAPARMTNSTAHAMRTPMTPNHTMCTSAGPQSPPDGHRVMGTAKPVEPCRHAPGI
jgi:hypothetical protein